MVEEYRVTSGGNEGRRAEIDTSAPFESVKDAVSRFGGIGFWKPSDHYKKSSSSESENTEDIDIEKLGEQTASVEKDLILKERETLDVLKELESTKLLIDKLKFDLQKEEAPAGGINPVNVIAAAAIDESDKENHFTPPNITTVAAAPSLILMELKQAKMNLSKTTVDLASIRSSVESFNKKIDKERISLEKTRERLTHNTSKMSLLEEELTQTRLKLHLAKDMENGDNRELHRLSSEIEQFKKVGQAAKLQVQRALTEIEQTKNQITTAEMRLVAAKKMKEAARATEAVALEEIKALSLEKFDSEEAVTLTYEDYASLVSKAREAEEESNKKVVCALLKVDEANTSKVEILKKVEEATEEMKTSKKVLEEALDRVEAASRGKLEVEEALRKWRSDNGRKRRTLGTKFKNSSYRSQIVDDGPVLKQTISIGQILSQKLMLAEEFESGKEALKLKKVSFGQMLGSCKQKNDDDLGGSHRDHHKQFSGSKKKNKLGFARFSLLVAKKSKKKKKLFCDLR